MSNINKENVLEAITSLKVLGTDDANVKAAFLRKCEAEGVEVKNLPTETLDNLKMIISVTLDTAYDIIKKLPAEADTTKDELLKQLLNTLDKEAEVITASLKTDISTKSSKERQIERSTIWEIKAWIRQLFLNPLPYMKPAPEPFKTLRFEGSSDDLFGEYGVTDTELDNCSTGKPLGFKIEAEGKSMKVIGRYSNGCWGIEAVQGESEDQPETIPDWNMRMSFKKNGYTAVLEVDIPNVFTLTPLKLKGE